MDNLTLRKIRAAAVSYGRGRDSTRTPATWGLYSADGTLRYRLTCDALRYAQRATWAVERIDADGRAVRVAYARTRGEAESKARAHAAEAL